MLNMPPVMESIHNLSRSFLKEKMQRRQHIHPKVRGKLSVVLDKMVANLGLRTHELLYGEIGNIIAWEEM